MVPSTPEWKLNVGKLFKDIQSLDHQIIQYFTTSETIEGESSYKSLADGSSTVQ